MKLSIKNNIKTYIIFILFMFFHPIFSQSLHFMTDVKILSYNYLNKFLATICCDSPQSNFFVNKLRTRHDIWTNDLPTYQEMNLEKNLINKAYNIIKKVENKNLRYADINSINFFVYLKNNRIHVNQSEIEEVD